MTTPTPLPHFAVDVAGLRRVLTRRGIETVVYELVANAWDTDADRVEISLLPAPDDPAASLITVTDNDLAHAYTLWSDSDRRADATRRGRFSAGEKTVIATAIAGDGGGCAITTTTGTVTFDEDGRRHDPGRRTERGSVFSGRLPTDAAARERTLAALGTLLAPAGVLTLVNGEPLAAREPAAVATATLPTDLADAEGYLRRTRRKAEIHVHEPAPGEHATLYELGVPVSRTGDRFHYDVRQKVPLGMDRDAVTPGYLRAVRIAVLDHMAASLDPEEAAARWVADALPRATDEAVRTVIETRYGEHRVIRDPSDQEAVQIAVSKGYSVLEPGAHSRSEWTAIRRARAALPAGRVTPSPAKVAADVRPEDITAPADWTAGERAIAEISARLARRLIDVEVQVEFRRSRRAYCAAYGRRGARQGHLIYNTSLLGPEFLAGPSDGMLDLLTHELGHHFCGDHLASEYHEALTRIAARMARLALTEPQLFAGVREGGRFVGTPEKELPPDLDEVAQQETRAA